MPKPKFKHEADRREILEELQGMELKVTLMVRDRNGDIGTATQPLEDCDGILPAIADYILEREDRHNA